MKSKGKYAKVGRKKRVDFKSCLRKVGTNERERENLERFPPDFDQHIPGYVKCLPFGRFFG